MPQTVSCWSLTKEV